MTKELLTDIKIKNLRPDPVKQYEVWDTKIPGFGVRVSSGGTKSMVLLYRIGTRSRRQTLGRYPALTLANGRSLARQALTDVAGGKDPAQERRNNQRNSYDFSEFVDFYIETYAKQQNKAWEENHRILKRDFVREWRKRDVRQIKKADVTAILDRMIKSKKPSAANHAFAHITIQLGC